MKQPLDNSEYISEPPCANHCEHDPSFYRLNDDPRAVDENAVGPRCWHEDEDGFCGHRCVPVDDPIYDIGKDPVSVHAVEPQKERKSLQQLGIEIREINAANGWSVTIPEEFGDKYKFPAVLALIHSEVSEALEAFREGDVEHFKEEMADVLIRVLDCVVGIDPDFDATVEAKMQVNRGRGYHHGGKKRI